ncbi:hypothetical protein CAUPRSCDRAFT_12061 [Caulochytrium protostelioides]|nr:hypothetical protein CAUPRSCDRAFT_12061 [Caulochytrium protostelioides]
MPDGVAAEVAMTTTVAAVPAGRGHLVRRQEHIFSGTLIIVGAALSTLITAYWVHSYLTMTLPMRLRKRMNKNILSKALYWIVLVSGLYFLWAGFFLAGRSIYRTTSSLLRTKVFAPAETGENAGRQASKSLPKPASMPGAWVEEPIEPFIEDLPSNLGREATGVKDAVRSLSALKPAPSSKIPGVWEGKSVRRIVPELPTSSGRSVTTDAATLAKSGKVPTLSAKPDAAAVRSAAAPVGDLPQLEGSTVSSGSSVMTDATKLAKAGEVPKQPVELDAASVLPADEMLDGLSHLKGSPVSSDSFKAIPETDERPFHMPGSWVD